MPRPDDNNQSPEAEYKGVHEAYDGVHNIYSGVHNQYYGVDTNTEIPGVEDDDVKEPNVAPGMADFIEQDATPKEVKEGDFTRVTTLSFDETH